MSAPIIEWLFYISLGLPLAAFVLSFAAEERRWMNAAVQTLFIIAAAAGLGAVYFSYQALQAGAGTIQLLNLPFAVTPLATLFLSLIYAGVALTSVYAIGSLPAYRDVYSLPALNGATALFIVGMQAVVLAPSVLVFLVAWEAMSMSAYFLVIADRRSESLSAGFLYFVMTHIGFFALLGGFMILSGGAVSLSWNDLAAHASQMGFLPLSAAFALLFAGFASKAGLVPLHVWLPYAHPQAPSGSSALLSGVMLKVALFGFLNVLAIFPFIPLSWAVAVVAFGLLSAFFGVLYAVVENDAKRLLAWSSIENMGLIFSGVGMYMAASALGGEFVRFAPLFMLFVFMHAVNHFLFKSGLFMAVGTIQSGTHTRDLDLLGGLAQKWPFFSAVFLVLALAASALPPMGTFFGEWVYVQSLAQAVSTTPLPYAIASALALALVGLVGGIAVAAFAKLFSAAFLGRARNDAVLHAAPPSVFMTVPIAACAVLSVAVGALSFPAVSREGLLSFLAPHSPAYAVPGASVMPLSVFLMAACALALAFLVRAFSHTSTRVTDTWDCGAPLTARMQYTATGFSAPLRFFFRSIVRSEKRLVREPVVPENPWIASRSLEWEVGSVWDAWLYRPLTRSILRGASIVRRLQSGVVQFYLLLVLVSLIIVLAISL